MRNWISEFTYRQRGSCRWSGRSRRKPRPPSGRWAGHASGRWAASAGDATPGPPPAVAGLSAAELHAARTYTEKHDRDSGKEFNLEN